MYDDLVLFQRFLFCCCFGRREVLEAIADEFNDLQYLASTKERSSALVGGAVLACVLLYFFRAFFFSFFFFLHFMVYSVEAVTEAF